MIPTSCVISSAGSVSSPASLTRLSIFWSRRWRLMIGSISPSESCHSSMISFWVSSSKVANVAADFKAKAALIRKQLADDNSPVNYGLADAMGDDDNLAPGEQ